MDNGKPTHFATFGGSQLEGFNVHPMNVMVTMRGSTEGELRQRLTEEPFDNKYCTTYPISEAARMTKDFNMKLIDIDVLLSLRVG